MKINEIYIDTDIEYKSIIVFANNEFIHIPFNQYAYPILGHLITLLDCDKVIVFTIGMGIAVYDYLLNKGINVESRKPCQSLHQSLRLIEKSVKSSEIDPRKMA